MATKKKPELTPAEPPAAGRPGLSPLSDYYKTQRDHLEMAVIGLRSEIERLREQIELLEAENENLTRSRGGLR